MVPILVLLGIVGLINGLFILYLWKIGWYELRRNYGSRTDIGERGESLNLKFLSIRDVSEPSFFGGHRSFFKMESYSDGMTISCIFPLACVGKVWIRSSDISGVFWERRNIGPLQISLAYVSLADMSERICIDGDDSKKVAVLDQVAADRGQGDSSA